MTNIDIVRSLDRLRNDSLYVHNDELPGASFYSDRLKGRKVYLVETLAVINALVERGTMMLFGGHGGGKTTLAKYLGQIFCHLTKDKIEDCILRGHPQLTEEKILGSLDFAQITNNKPLNKYGKIDVVWNSFVDSKWKIIDEINRLSPYAQNILLSLLAEGTVKYQDESRIIPPFTLYATLNPKDNANEELSLPFKDRFALALPITMPDYDSFSTIGKRDKNSRDKLEEYLPNIDLSEVQKDIKSISYTSEAELFINYIIASYRLCMRASKESNDTLSVDKNLCENCRMKGEEKVCNKIKQPLSVRVKEDLYRYGKALAWFLGAPQVTTEHIMTLAPYMIWHRTVLSKKFTLSLTEAWKDESSKKHLNDFITNIDLNGTRTLIQLIKKEFDGVKHLLEKFEEVKTGKLSQTEFDAFLSEASSSTYNSLILNAEILPVLKEKYLPVYGRIIDYNKKIDSCSNKDELKSLKEDMAFTYDIPNRQYLSAKIDIRLKGMKMRKSKFTLSKENVIANAKILSSIRVLAPNFEELGLLKNNDYQILDITKDECTLNVRFARDLYNFVYEGDENDEIFQYLSTHAC
ncbi:AAA family ATPase [Bacteroides acidifaciens]|nr:MoxR family ATPase [Bacteroides acidifaciens]